MSDVYFDVGYSMLCNIFLSAKYDKAIKSKHDYDIYD